jgi:phage terminase large subunit GpA-like protein
VQTGHAIAGRTFFFWKRERLGGTSEAEREAKVGRRFWVVCVGVSESLSEMNKMKEKMRKMAPKTQSTSGRLCRNERALKEEERKRATTAHGVFET